MIFYIYQFVIKQQCKNYLHFLFTKKIKYHSEWVNGINIFDQRNKNKLGVGWWVLTPNSMFVDDGEVSQNELWNLDECKITYSYFETSW